MSRHSASILIVDDEKSILELTSAVLRNRGFRVKTATDGKSALELIVGDEPDLVLLDYVMPGMDGFSALKEIKQRFPGISVIILSGEGDGQIAVELMKRGASGYIQKPFLNQDLVESVDKALKVRGEARNRERLKERDRLLEEIENRSMELEERVREKSIELQRVQDEIIHTEKMSTVGYLSAGMAHEIRNPLNSIGLFVQILKENPEEPERLECLEKIEQEVRRIDAILKKLMDAVKGPRFHISEVSVDRVLDTVIDFLRSRLEMNGIRIRRDFRVIPSPVSADQTEIEQVFTNIMVNSIEEMPGGGVIGVTLDQNDSEVIVRISDTGRGILQEHMTRIFDPFFTTKTSGTGLGLYAVMRIVRAYNGRIDVRSEDGKGTTFSVFLRVSDAVP